MCGLEKYTGIRCSVAENSADCTIKGIGKFIEEEEIRLNKEHDEFRTEILEGYDLTVIRFTNRQVDDNFCGVCKFIDFTVKALLTPEPPSVREVAFAKGSPTEKPLQMTEGESRRQ